MEVDNEALLLFKLDLEKFPFACANVDSKTTMQ